MHARRKGFSTIKQRPGSRGRPERTKPRARTSRAHIIAGPKTAAALNWRSTHIYWNDGGAPNARARSTGSACIGPDDGDADDDVHCARVRVCEYPNKRIYLFAFQAGPLYMTCVLPLFIGAHTDTEILTSSPSNAKAIPHGKKHTHARTPRHAENGCVTTRCCRRRRRRRPNTHSI